MTKKLIIFSLFIIACTLMSVAQITRQGESFTNVSVINNKVVFVKEVKIKDGSPVNGFTVLKEWGRENYGKDPFISSVRYDDRKREIIAKSRIELVFPENSRGVREKMIMRFRVDGFIFDDKCVIEISDLSYLSDNAKDKKLPRVVRAEDFITDEIIAEEGDLQEFRANARKSTLYFLNTLAKDFEEKFGY